MKNYSLCLIIAALFLYFNQSIAQSYYNTNNTVVTSYELEAKSYERDSTANALVIFEDGNSYIDRDSGNLITEIQKKIKIFNSEGFKHANVVIPIYRNGKVNEKVYDIKGLTSNIQGTIKLTNDDIFLDNSTENYKLVKFTFPNIQEGSVISYSYTIESPFLTKYHGWKFQSSIPKLKSVYHSSIPANYEYSLQLVGTLKLHDQQSVIVENCYGNAFANASCSNTTFIMKDIPAFIEENFMTDSSNYLSQLDYELNTIKHFDGRVDELTKSWKSADEEIRTEVFNKQFYKTGPIKSELSKIALKSTPLESAKSIYEHIQNNYSWNSKYSIYRDNDIKTLLKEKKGNATVINLLLANMLFESGINAKPVLASTRPNGIPTKLYPVITDFNYLIVSALINGETYLLDATDKHLFFGELPFKCLNYSGRQFPEKGASQWIDIEPRGSTYIQQVAEISINDAENILDATLKSTTNGYASLGKRKRYFSNPVKYAENINFNNPNLEFVEHNLVSGALNKSKFEEEFRFKIDFDKINGRLYINPFITKMFESNPFKLQERTYPIEFGYKDSYIYKARLLIDESYNISEIPQDYTYSLPNKTGTIILKFIQKENEIQVFLKFNFGLANYNADYYEYLKIFVSKIIDIQKNSIIILEKKIN
ncbi:MAG: hypothetical protein BM564_07315 [Bacteroidetes bacterium MedPE-SWsnd-G2]|nr:MAG: hypothetical protein BM564_07315 [Bacteroidetes bacterium MedPE-SWsnd-G2]